jgi:hypothetical protein
MSEHKNREQQGLLEGRIATSMEELRQLHHMPTLDDFQEFRRRKLEYGLGELREELRALEADQIGLLPATG